VHQSSGRRVRLPLRSSNAVFAALTVVLSMCAYAAARMIARRSSEAAYADTDDNQARRGRPPSPRQPDAPIGDLFKPAPGERAVILLSLPMLSDIQRERFESPQASALFDVVIKWLFARLGAERCDKRGEIVATTTVSVRFQVRSHSEVATIDGDSVDVVELKGAPVPDAVKECIRHSVAGQHMIDLSAVSAGLISNIRKTYALSAETRVTFPESFAGSAGGNLVFRKTGGAER
jgi:hypothetical protein